MCKLLRIPDDDDRLPMHQGTQTSDDSSKQLNKMADKI